MREIAHILRQNNQKMGVRGKAVKHIMQKRVILIYENNNISDASNLLRRHNIRHLPVMKGVKLVGILSDRDVRLAATTPVNNPEASGRFFYRSRDIEFKDVKVGEVMSKRLITVRPNTWIKTAVNLMLKNRIGCVPVVNQDGRFEGIITETDLLRFLANILSKRDEEREGRLKVDD